MQEYNLKDKTLECLPDINTFQPGVKRKYINYSKQEINCKDGVRNLT